MSSLKIVLALLFAGIALYVARVFSEGSKFVASEQKKSIFDFEVESIEGKLTSLSDYKGKKAYLVVNVASQCGLTQKNYAQLQELYEKYQNKGLEILAFPCDNFLHQEPADNSEICEFAQKTKGATFPILGKLECDNKEKTHPLYQSLMSSLDGGLFGQGLKWNFAKFLCDADGIPIQRYMPITSPMFIEKDIVELLKK